MDVRDIRIVSAGTELPGPPVDNATLTRRFNMPPQAEQWIDGFIGTKTRHFALDLDSGEVQYSLADMGESAGRRALEAAGIGPGDVDVMVMGTSTPDMLLPTTASQIADRLGVDGVPTYQLQSGCTGAVQALNIAYQMLLTGAHRTALVLGAETIAKHFDPDGPVGDPQEQVGGVIFGDGAGALVLTSRPAGSAPSVRRVFHKLVGLNRPPGHIMEWFGVAELDSDRPAVQEDYKAIEQSVPRMAAEVVEELLGDLAWKPDEVDFLLPPQLSGVMTGRIVKQLALPRAREISCVTRTGNTANALPFFQLEQLLPEMRDGERALAVSVESSKWIKAGFAVEKG